MPKVYAGFTQNAYSAGIRAFPFDEKKAREYNARNTKAFRSGSHPFSKMSIVHRETSKLSSESRRRREEYGDNFIGGR